MGLWILNFLTASLLAVAVALFAATGYGVFAAHDLRGAGMCALFAGVASFLSWLCSKMARDIVARKWIGE